MVKIKKILSKDYKQRDLYYFFLTSSWKKLFVVILVNYVLVNMMFAFIYTAIPNSLNNETPQFLDAFFFSVQTMTTIGYGAISPTGTWSNMIVVFEAFLGIIGVAVMTGVVFAKIAKPQARIRFSKNILLSPVNGVKCICFRIGNTRENDIVEARVHVSALINEKTLEGEKMRRIYNLNLVRSYTPFFRLTWSIFHELNEGSPLKNFDEIKDQLEAFMVTVTGHDGTYSTTVYNRHLYSKDDLVIGGYFQDIMSEDDIGNIKIDYAKFDELKTSSLS